MSTVGATARNTSTSAVRTAESTPANSSPTPATPAATATPRTRLVSLVDVGNHLAAQKSSHPRSLIQKSLDDLAESARNCYQIIPCSRGAPNRQRLLRSIERRSLAEP